MPLRLTELSSNGEFPDLMATLYDSYSNPYNGFWDISKGMSGEECQARYTGWHKSDPSSHWIYVTDTETGQVIGGTQWNVYETNPYAEPHPPMTAYWIEEETELRSKADSVLGNFLAGRPHRMNRPHMRKITPVGNIPPPNAFVIKMGFGLTSEVVMWCGTHSEHRRRGAGLMMLNWGLEKADAMGLDAFVEATEAGWELYKAAGFITVNDFWADAETDKPTGEWKRLREELRFPMHGYFMWRPPGGKYERGVTKFPWE